MMCAGRHLPWLQDTVADSVWTSWGVVYRDVFVLDPENRVERVYREALADLFSGPKDAQEIMDILKLRELYRHLSNCADRGDEAANIIHDIVVKTT
jgi:hypothetical protein